MIGQLKSTEPQRSTQTNQQYQELEAVTNHNEKLAAELTERLRAVLRPDAPIGNAGERCSPEEMLVPLAEGLRSVAKSAKRTNSVLTQLLERIEV